MKNPTNESGVDVVLVLIAILIILVALALMYTIAGGPAYYE